MDAIQKLNHFYEEKLSISEVKEYLKQYDGQIDGFIIYGCGPLGNYLKDISQDTSPAAYVCSIFSLIILLLFS